MKEENNETKKKSKNQEWIEWRRAKKEGRLTEHRRELKKEANKQDSTRQK